MASPRPEHVMIAENTPSALEPVHRRSAVTSAVAEFPGPGAER